MKSIYQLFIILFTTLQFISCQDVVDIDLDNDAPKIVIEASINWQKGTPGNSQKIKLTTTSNYYSNNIPVVNGASVTITNSLNTVFNFEEKPGTGEYICTNFIPVLNETYTLKIISNGKTYTSVDTLVPVAKIETIEQTDTGGLTGKELQIRTVYLDPEESKNFYLYKYRYINKIKPQIYTDDDVFFNGNPFFSVSFEDELKVGDQIEVTHYGISQNYYNYMSILLSVAGNNGGGPFQAPPVTLRGNIINTTNPDDFPFGYFSLSEIDSRLYTIK
jgi:hypothetical protein